MDFFWFFKTCAFFQITRLQFKRLVSPEFASIMSLHTGEAYAMQNLTRTDRLGLLLTGRVNVLCDSNYLHSILPCDFLDSPEFESSKASMDDKFKVRNEIYWTSLFFYNYYFCVNYLQLCTLCFRFRLLQRVRQDIYIGKDQPWIIY